MRSFHLRARASLLCLAWLSACSKEAPKPGAKAPPAASETTAAAPPAAVPAEQPRQPPAAAPASTTAPPAGPAAIEKHRLRVTNYARTSLSVSLNSEWVGQWDDHITVPVERIVQGKNTMTVDLAAEPTNELKLELQAERGSDWVSLLTLNFKGKTGSQTIPFVAK